MSNRQPGRPMTVRPRILETASEMFLEQGLDISLDAIASEAGTTRQTLYNHFPSKDALVLETFKDLIEKMQPPLNAIMAGDTQDLSSVLMRFASVVQDHFFQLRNIHFQRLLIQLLQQRPELYETLRSRNAGQVLSTMTSLLKQAKARGQISDCEDEELQGAAFLGAIMGYPLPAAWVADRVWSPERLHQLAAISTAAFLRAWGYQQ